MSTSASAVEVMTDAFVAKGIYQMFVHPGDPRIEPIAQVRSRSVDLVPARLAETEATIEKTPAAVLGASFHQARTGNPDHGDTFLGSGILSPDSAGPVSWLDEAVANATHVAVGGASTGPLRRG